MSRTLQVKGLGKSYKDWGSEWRRIMSWIMPALSPVEEKWVLKDVSFSVERGEAIGLIGQNGAGKSTLLKLITGITQASQGSIELNGSMAAILELGMGFSPDLTGRQNVFHAAGLMGYSVSAIEKAMPAIESFAEIGGYFDQPVRTYSSGMQVRVAFSVATAFRPDLLIIDEALSVGDSYFQHKSFDRIRRYRDDGVSVLLVSHSLEDVRTLCDRVILLGEGRVLKQGQPDEVIDYYNAYISEKENLKAAVEQCRTEDGRVLTRSGSGYACIDSVKLKDMNNGSELGMVQVGQEVELCIKVSVHAAVPRLVLGYLIRDRQGHLVWGSNTWHTRQVQNNLRSGEQLDFSLKFICSLGPGSYSVSVALHDSDTHLNNNYDWIDNFFVFDVVNTKKAEFIGVNWIDVCTSVFRGSSVDKKLVSESISGTV